MQSLMRLLCLGYLIFLTVLLLTKDPLLLVGVRGNMPTLLCMLIPMAHLLSFLMLAVLALTTRWPAPRWAIVLFLLLYAAMTELMQGFLPPRRAEWGDWLQDLAGIAAGAALCWIVALAAGPLNGSSRDFNECAASEMSGEWNLIGKVMSRPTSRNQSWWG